MGISIILHSAMAMCCMWSSAPAFKDMEPA
jgi:hypothetical protein